MSRICRIERKVWFERDVERIAIAVLSAIFERLEELMARFASRTYITVHDEQN